MLLLLLTPNPILSLSSLKDVIVPSAWTSMSTI